ncbi:HVA1 family protein [Sphingomonas sp.]
MRKSLAGQTRDTKIKGRQVRASEANPQYVLRSDSGGRAPQ